MSAVELCTYAGELSGLPRTEAMQRAHAALYYAGLEEKRYQPIDGYSTGMKQRVKLAQALVHDPELLFLDEPTNGLDPRSRDEMLELIIELPARRDCAIVLSTHLLPDVERVCDHAVIMHQGRVRFVGSIDELRGARGRDRASSSSRSRPTPAKLGDGADRRRRDVRSSISPVRSRSTCRRRATTELVFRRARDAGLQVRGIERAARDRRGGVPARRSRRTRRERAGGTIHDLGYKRYVGTRRLAGTRWRVIMRHQVATAGRRGGGSRRALGLAVIVDVHRRRVMFILTNQIVRTAWGMIGGIATRMADAALPKSIEWFTPHRVPRQPDDRRARSSRATCRAARSRSTSRARSRPRDYVLGKLAGMLGADVAIMLAGPLLLAGRAPRPVGDRPTSSSPRSPVLPKALAIGALGTVAYAAVPLGFSALIAEPAPRDGAVGRVLPGGRPDR